MLQDSVMPVEESGDMDDLDCLLADAQEQQEQSFQRLNQSKNLTNATLDQPAVDDVAEFEDFNPHEFESNIQIFDLLRQDNCVHEVAVPKSIQYTRIDDGQRKEMVKTYPFELDSFQSEAIDCLNNYQSVLVSAHTSAGKTVVALYAVALALRENQRVIYTTPIKALSNQKYRELLEEFGDVGLMTGDVTLNPEASCLVMTTEILRSMLYRGSEIMREVGWVVFDEIHYMRDAERGVVWEETIILLPDNVHYVFLSATIPNAKQFAAWIANLHNQVCHIVYTDYRPTPLRHVFYSSGSNGLYEVVNAKGEFREEQFSKAMSFINDGAQENSREARNRAMQVTTNNVTLLIRTIRERELLPCIVFSFSRKECEAYASGLKEMDFNDKTQKSTITEIFQNAVSLLSEEDQKLPQIKWILPYLLRGIGIHHSGLLPLLKECIEILFGEGLLKILFATETFAMGLNMPARTVLFTSARKFDGRENRWISSGEYIQMSGRAGRRGLDAQGLVILMVDQKMSADVAKNIIKGHTDPLNSQFRLTYNMVLNLTRVPEINPQYMMERSFRYFQNKSLLPPLYEKWQAKKKELEDCKVDSEEELQSFNNLKVVAEDVRKRIQKTALQPRYLSSFFHAGRLFRVQTTEVDLGWGILLNAKKQINKMGDTVYVMEMVLRLSWDCLKDLNNVEKLRPPRPNESAAAKFIPVDLQCITAVSSIRVKIPEEGNQERLKEILGKTLEKALAKYNNVPPELDPINDLGVKDQSFKNDIEHLKKLEEQISIHPIRQRPDFDTIYASFERKLQLHEEMRVAREELKTIKSGQFSEELTHRQKVLRRMGYIDIYGTITQKGRIACEISAADEILLTEMLLTGVFGDMTSADAAALLSCFVFEEKTDKMPKLDDKLQQAFNTLVSHARKVAKVSIECNMDIIEEKYIEKLQNGIMPVVKQWCSGASFKQISEDSGIFEGSIIRCLRRLEELLREMVSAVKAMGDDKLSESFEEASKNLKRDIVFAASLYL